jgi:hypothetical protein
MRRVFLLSLFTVLVSEASAQRGGGIGRGVGRGGFSRGGFQRDRFRGNGFTWLPYGSGYANDGFVPYYDSRPYEYTPQPNIIVQPPPPREARPVIIEYPQPVPAPASRAEGEPQNFGIVLKDGSTLSAIAVVVSHDVLHYVDPQERNMEISISEVDRDATLKLNRERKLTLSLPATSRSTATPTPNR